MVKYIFFLVFFLILLQIFVYLTIGGFILSEIHQAGGIKEGIIQSLQWIKDIFNSIQ